MKLGFFLFSCEAGVMHVSATVSVLHHFGKQKDKQSARLLNHPPCLRSGRRPPPCLALLPLRQHSASQPHGCRRLRYCPPFADAEAHGAIPMVRPATTHPIAANTENASKCLVYVPDAVVDTPPGVVHTYLVRAPAAICRAPCSRASCVVCKDWRESLRATSACGWFRSSTGAAHDSLKNVIGLVCQRR